MGQGREEPNGDKAGTVVGKDAGALEPILIVSCCDQAYLPLVKGLYLSLLRDGPLPATVGLAFIDMGCDPASLAWLEGIGVAVRALDPTVLGPAATPELGYRLAQVCRPFLPRLFPQADTIAWMDADLWVQDRAGVLRILAAAASTRDKVLASPEFHASYARVADFAVRRREALALTEPLFGADAATALAGRPAFNSGFFAAAADHPIWAAWAREIHRIYGRPDPAINRTVLHFAEQTAFNHLIHGQGWALPFDPTFNYLSLWTPPVRGTDGIVRIALPPNLPVGVVHLAGGWRFFGAGYMADGLLFDAGRYLTPSEREALDAECHLPDRRYG